MPVPIAAPRWAEDFPSPAAVPEAEPGVCEEDFATDGFAGVATAAVSAGFGAAFMGSGAGTGDGAGSGFGAGVGFAGVTAFGTGTVCSGAGAFFTASLPFFGSVTDFPSFVPDATPFAM